MRTKGNYLKSMIDVFNDNGGFADIHDFENAGFDVDCADSDQFVNHFIELRDGGHITTDDQESKHDLGLKFEVSGRKKYPVWWPVKLYLTKKHKKT